jgi:hypothetical protein
MTEIAEEQINHEKSLDDAPSVPDQPSVDFVLQAIVQLANDTGVEMGITLCVGGIVVAGLLISGRNYFEGIAREALQASGPPDQAGVRQTFSDYLGNFGKLIYEQTETKDRSDDEQDETRSRVPGFIHLREARFFHNSGKPMPANKGIWWRGRLTAIDGFSLGAMFST